MRIFRRPVTGWRLKILRAKNKLTNWAKRRRVSFWCDMLGHKYGPRELRVFQAWFQDSPRDIFTVKITQWECKRCHEQDGKTEFPDGLLRKRTIIFGERVEVQIDKELK